MPSVSIAITASSSSSSSSSSCRCCCYGAHNYSYVYELNIYIPMLYIYIYIYSAPGILYSCATEFKQLRYLSINGNRHVNDTTMSVLLPLLKEIRELDIGATAIRDRSMVLIGKYCQKLESLDVSDCHRITEVGVRCVTSQLPHLSYLSIENCYNVVSMEGEFDGIAVEEEGDWEDEPEDEDEEEREREREAGTD